MHAGSSCFIQTSPPAGSLTRFRPRPRLGRRARGTCRRRLSPITLVHLPVRAVSALWCELAYRNIIVLPQDILDDDANLVCADSHTPSKIGYHVIDAFVTSVACCFQSITSKCTRRCHPVAGADVDRVRCVPKMKCACILPCLWCAWVCSRRYWEPKTCNRESFRHSFKGHSWDSICES